jgi:hypothetical protein
MWKVPFLLNHRTTYNKEIEITAAGTQHFHHVLIAKNPIIHKADAGGGQI